jgi:hypothetical protein
MVLYNKGTQAMTIRKTIIKLAWFSKIQSERKTAIEEYKKPIKNNLMGFFSALIG